MKPGTKRMLSILLILSWIIFVGVCIEAGGFIANSFLGLVLKPEQVKHLWQQVDLSALYNYDRGYFFVITLVMSIVAVMRACIFYLIIKMLHEKKLNLAQPFNKEMQRFVFNVSYLSFLIGLFSVCGDNYSEWLVSQGVSMPDIQYLRLGGADVWLFMSVILYVIAQIFKRGIEIQKENELTV